MEHTSNDEKYKEIELRVKEEHEKYAQMVQDRFVSIKDGFSSFYERGTPKVDFDDSLEYKNIVKGNLENYSTQDLKDKFSYYLQKSNKEGILSIEVDTQHEKNTLLKKLFEMMVDGFNLEYIDEHILLEEKSYIKRFDTMFEMLRVAMLGIEDGNNPRALESKLLTFIEPKERKSLFD